MAFWKRFFGGKVKSQSVAKDAKSVTTMESSALPNIHMAAGDGDLETVRALLQGNPGLISLKDSRGYIPLHRAVEADRIDVAELLLSRGSIATSVSLECAQSRRMAELLLAYDAEVNPKDKGGWTPLLSAAASGRKEVVELFLANKAEVNAKNNPDGWTSLHLAAYFNHLEVARLLVAAGADVNAVGNDKQTPLHAAVRHDAGSEMVNLLLANGAEVNVYDKAKKTPLHLAVVQGKRDVVELLLVHKAHVNAKDGRGKTPLQMAMIVEQQDIAGLLRQYGGQEANTVLITVVTLPTELIEAAKLLERRLRQTDVTTRKVPIGEWNVVPQNIHDLIPNWVPTLLAEFSLLGAVFECRNNSADTTQPRYFSFWGPEHYATNLSGKNRWCYVDEFIADGLVMISDETNGDVWLTSISGGPSSPVYLFDLSGYKRIIASTGVATFLSGMVVKIDAI